MRQKEKEREGHPIEKGMLVGFGRASAAGFTTKFMDMVEYVIWSNAEREKKRKSERDSWQIL